MAPDKGEQPEGRDMPAELTDFERGFQAFCHGLGLLFLLILAFVGAVRLWGWAWVR